MMPLNPVIAAVAPAMTGSKSVSTAARETRNMPSRRQTARRRNKTGVLLVLLQPEVLAHHLHHLLLPQAVIQLILVVGGKLSTR